MVNVNSIVKEATSKNMESAIKLNKFLYDHPELAYNEKQSSAEIVRLLREFGYEVEYPFLEKELGYDTAFRAVLDNGEGESIAIMTEYDALPDLGHGCGHNFSGSLSALSALTFTEIKDQFKGKIYVIGTPAEEEAGAKTKMAELGIFDGMSLASMAHAWSGEVSYPQMDVLSLRAYSIEFFGKESHASVNPWDGNSALACARKFLDLIDARREGFTADLRVNAIITEGGNAPNILPKYASIRLELRAGSKSKLEHTDDIVRKCAGGAAMAFDCTVEFKKCFDDFFDMVRPLPIEDAVINFMKEIGLPVRETTVACGSSDVGNVSYKCPTTQMLVSISDEAFPLHTPQMRDATLKAKAIENLEKGSAVLTLLSLRALTDKTFRDDVQKSFKEACTNKM